MQYRGGKITDSHSTASDASNEILALVRKRPEVSKISLGFIENIGGSRRSLKFSTIVGGIRVRVRGSGATQEMYIYTSDPEATKEALIKAFLEK